MAYTRGNGTVEAELSNVQGWVERADVDLYGRNGDVGVLREHRDDREHRKTQEEENHKYNRRVILAVGFLGTGFPVIIKVLELLHVLPK